MWINHINDETRMAEELNAVLPPKRVAQKPAAAAATSTTTVTTTTSTNIITDSIAGVSKTASQVMDPNALGSNIAKLQNSLKEIPNHLMSPAEGEKTTSPEIAAAKLALSTQSAYALPAITREQAAPIARESAGKIDPLAPISGYRSFPTSGERRVSKQDEEKHSGHKTGLIPPPPIDGIPPPPPPILSGAQGESLPLSELPTPPEKPSIAKHLKLVGILGDRAFMSVTDPNLRRTYRLPKTLALSAGDTVDFLNVIAVSSSSVTLEEEGERTVKHLAALR